MLHLKINRLCDCIDVNSASWLGGILLLLHEDTKLILSNEIHGCGVTFGVWLLHDMTTAAKGHDWVMCLG